MPDPTLKPRRSRARRWLLALAILAGGLLLLEVGTRVVLWARGKPYSSARTGAPIAIAEMSLVREELPGLPTVLVADRPSTIVTIERAVSDAWGRTNEDLFARALANLAEQHPVVSTPLDLDAQKGLRAWVIESEHLFGASHVLRLDAWPEVLGTHGTLVAVPSRHALIAYPIDSKAVLDAIPILAQVANSACNTGPGSITPDLFWRTRDGRFERMGVAVSPGKVALTPSVGFTELLNGVAE